jgi:geranylgeranyl transferase type-2 subunit alpha
MNAIPVQAFATDSNDQSPWMYYRWLVGNSLAHMELAKGKPREEEEAGAVLRNVLQREVQRFEEDHIRAVPDAKWPLLTVARLKEAQARLGLCDGDPAALLEDVKGIYRRLMELDPMRKGYYQDAVDGKAFVVVQALGTM